MTQLPPDSTAPTTGGGERGEGKIEKLECVRGFAAFYVMASHASSNGLHLQRSWIGQPFRFAQEGVLLFFLLSGFVIYYSWHGSRNPRDFRTFLFKRFRRIYPIYVVALVLTYVCASLNWGFDRPDWGSFFDNLFMIQGTDQDHGPKVFMGNGPLWSLSYEWWFYMMFFPIYLYVAKSAQKYLVLAGALAGVVGELLVPNIAFHILASFPLWWAGVELAREYMERDTFTVARQAGMLGIILGLTLVYGGLVAWWYQRGLPLVALKFPMLEFRRYGVVSALLVVFFAWRSIGFAGFKYTLGPFQVFAALSYALYLFHFPVLCLLPTLVSLWFPWLDVALKVALALGLAYLAEEVWQAMVNRWLNRWFYGSKVARV